MKTKSISLSFVLVSFFLPFVFSTQIYAEPNKHKVDKPTCVMMRGNYDEPQQGQIAVSVNNEIHYNGELPLPKQYLQSYWFGVDQDYTGVAMVNINGHFCVGKNTFDYYSLEPGIALMVEVTVKPTGRCEVSLYRSFTGCQ